MRNREIQVKFWVTSEELEVIQEKMKLAGIKNRGSYLRKMAMDGYYIQLDLSDVKELIRLLRITSNNLNQYAKKAHETQSIYYEDIAELQKRQEELWELMKKILERLSSIQ